MHRFREIVRFRPATPVLLLAVFLAAGGCATRGLPVESEVPAEIPPVVDESPDPVDPAPEEPSEEPSEVELHELADESPLPGEVVTDSPLDELAEVAPEIPVDSVEIPEEIEPSGPTFDIPIEINDRVRFFLDYYSTRQARSFEKGLIRSGRYMELFRRIYREEGLPLDLIYMAHVESGYKTTAYSRARARGIFQFMAATGRRYGLRIDYWVDERLDPEKSARASAAYLKDLYEEFGDWYLALAGYNAGEGKIRRALARSSHKDFWGIARTRYIRRETKNHVPAILAAVLISKEPERYGFDFEPDAPLVYESIEVDGAADLQVLADCAGTDLETMKHLNPALRRYQTPPHATTAVRVPPGAGEATLAALREIPAEERVLYVRHRVRSGDTLYALARRHGVSVSAIQQANRMGRRTMIRVGQEIVIPTIATGAQRARSVPPAGDSGEEETIVHRVRRGESLSVIARRYGTTPPAIARANGIGLDHVLQIGQPLRVAMRQAERSSSDNAPVGDEVIHTVRRGDTLWLIAKLYRTTVDAICELNRLSRNATLYPGTKLAVRTR